MLESFGIFGFTFRKVNDANPLGSLCFFLIGEKRSFFPILSESFGIFGFTSRQVNTRTPWDPYASLRSAYFFVFSILLESFGILWSTFRKVNCTNPLESRYIFWTSLKRRKKGVNPHGIWPFTSRPWLRPRVDLVCEPVCLRKRDWLFQYSCVSTCIWWKSAVYVYIFHVKRSLIIIHLQALGVRQ